MIARGDDPWHAGRRRRGQLDIQLPGLSVGGEAVQPPDVPGHVVHDRGAVGGGVAGVEPVVVGVPPQVIAGQGGRVQVPGALVIGQEHQPPADDHGRAELPGQLAEDPGEQRVLTGCDPQAARGAAPVALPVRGVAALPGQQDGRCCVECEVVDLTEGQAAGRGVQRHRVGHRALGGRLADGADREDLAGVRPAGDAGALVAPVGAPRRHASVGIGGVDLGDAPVTPACPRDRGTVGGEPRVAGLAAVGGQPPCAATLRWSEPDVVFGDKGQQVAINMGET